MPNSEPGSRRTDRIDRSKLTNKRAQPRIAESQRLVERTQHRWQSLPVGRVCSICQLAQAVDEMHDDVPCCAS
jgi:hypothetical protein